jgi:NAD(P)-dependent dehydrogenase (short-subunit alcohol dehydrogenase family)
VLVNNAGHDDRHAMEDAARDVDERLALNLKQSLLLRHPAVVSGRCRPAAVQRRQHGQRELDARPAEPGGLHHREGRHLARTLARELGPRHIRVNALCLGATSPSVRTRCNRDAAADQAFLDAQCLIRLDPGHVACATLFLAADDSATA